MICPRCNANQRGPDAAGKLCGRHGGIGGVIDTREPDDATTRRRRECWSCGFRWSTLEVIGTPDDGLRELEGQKFLSI